MEKFESLRDIAEYAMAFHNVEGVKAVQRARDERKLLEDKQTTDIFMQQVAELFGRELQIEDIQAAKNGLNNNSPSSPPTDTDIQQEDIIKIHRSE